ncbi:hypothetical protein F8388_011259 [Cannabis sativa]|uniref:Adenylosuccinate lyase n=1 Tax=Cannabis sativa TaxID=3483 RepID=A0A7J6FCX2_CANSA|nr:hypothetical protein F8388_011259 [Cannabis sativa]
MELGSSSLSFNTYLFSGFTPRPNESSTLFLLPLSFKPSSLSLARSQNPFRFKAIATQKTVKNMSRDLEYSTLTALSPLDGQYWGKVKDLAPYMSEYALIYYRILVEVQWLIKLSQIPGVEDVPSFSNDARSFLQGIIDGFTVDDALEIKKTERMTNHDVKAKCQSHPEIAKEALDNTILPVIDDLIEAIGQMAKDNAHISMLSRTHGQPASPTTLEKEMAIFAVRLSREKRDISQVEIMGKFAGAVGNYNAHLVAYHAIHWPQIDEEFVTSLGLSFNAYIITRLHGKIVSCNLPTEQYILIDYDRDIWGYISWGYFKQITMPHKVNPIDIENSEGNLGVANGTMSHLSTKFPISRFQRDLTDSTTMRNMGVGLGHSLLAYKSTLQRITKLQVNGAHLSENLDNCWEVLAEPIQTIMFCKMVSLWNLDGVLRIFDRWSGIIYWVSENLQQDVGCLEDHFAKHYVNKIRYGVLEPYEKLKELTRGRSVNKESIREFIEGLELPNQAKTELLKLTPHSYIGVAVDLALTTKKAVKLVNEKGHIFFFFTSRCSGLHAPFLLLIED